MSLKHILLSVSSVALLAPVAANAAGGGSDPTVYVSIGGGVTVPDDTEQSTIIAPFSGSNEFALPTGFDTGFEPGFNVGGIIGYKFNSNWRIEGELRYSSADIEETTANGEFDVPTAANPQGTLTPNSGDVSVTSVFANAAFDVPIGGRLVPYFGAGVGYADIDISGLGPESGEGVFAYQVFAGGNVEIDDISAIGARFSFINTADFEYDPVGLDTVAGAFTLGEAQYSGMDFTISYRRAFK